MKKISICGLQKTTLLDYPGHVAATIFLGGCNFRCPFCHNSELLDMNTPPLFTPEEILAFLKKRRNILEGVCITGGEPTLHAEALAVFLTAIKELGLLVKLDTNGNRPDVMIDLAARNLIDYVAVDIKAAPAHYPRVCGAPKFSSALIEKSIVWLKTAAISYELRTTAVKGLHDLEDFRQIGPWIDGCLHYYIQNYIASDRVLQPDGFDSFTKDELLAFCEVVKPYVGNVALRGIDY